VFFYENSEKCSLRGRSKERQRILRDLRSSENKSIYLAYLSSENEKIIFI